MSKALLPIGMQSFREIRNNGYAYEDKTPFISQMVEQGKYYFLSRPRRFGKSLLLDTMACLFSAKKELYQGLFMEDISNKERVDLTLKHKKGIWIFEVKGIDLSGDKKPLKQIKDRQYAEKYRSLGLPVYQIGLIFDKNTRNLESWEMEKL